MKKTQLFIIAFALWLPLLCHAQLTIEEHLAMENLNSPQVYQSKILYAQTHKTSWDGKTISSIITTGLDGQNEQSLTEGEYDYDPKWSKDGKWVSFISYRDNLQQIYIIPSNGGAPKMASDAQYYLSNHAWLDQNTIAYVDDEPEDSTWLAEMNMNGGGYWADTGFRTNALWAFDIETGTKKKLTDGTFRIIEFDISQDGKQLAMIAAKNYDTYEAITNNWVEVIDLESAKSIYKYNEGNSLNNPTFSPSGKQLSFAGSTEGYASNDALFVADLGSGKTHRLAYEIDPTIEKIRWADEDNIYFSTPRNGHTAIYKSNVNGKTKEVLAPYWVIYDFDFTEDHWYFTASRGSKTKQLYKLGVKAKPKNADAITNINADITAKIKTSSSLLDYYSADGTPVQGILNFPPAYKKGKAYPLMVIPHGGPDAVVLDDFNWMGQFFADNGYVVFQPNFRGSIGYGRDFYAGNRNAFGHTDYQDIMAGVDELIELGIANEDKLVLGGWSYGGYMAGWAITQTNRFKASIAVAGVFNLMSLYGQHEFSNREIGTWEYKALLIDQPENYRKASPIFHVKNANTPLLILHGANDIRSPTLQAWEMYRAMKDAGKNVEMMLYNRAGHGISNPTQRKSVLTQWLNWANQHIGRD